MYITTFVNFIFAMHLLTTHLLQKWDHMVHSVLQCIFHVSTYRGHLSMSAHIDLPHSFYWLYSVPLYRGTLIYLTSSPLVDIWAVIRIFLLYILPLFCLSFSTDSYIEVLDGSRVHPETYEWARKMAVDALEYDESAEDANPAGALEEILENPERLKDLDLDAFAEELERQVGDNVESRA